MGGIGNTDATCRHRSHRKCHATWDEPEQSDPGPGAITRAPSYGFRLRVRTIEERSASLSRGSRRARRKWTIDVAASGRALVFHLVQPRGADRSDTRRAARVVVARAVASAPG